MLKDLTVGKPGKVLWQYTIPMFIGVAFQQMYNIADSIIVGKFAGEQALAAVGASYPITMLLMAIAIGSQMGVSVVVSQLFGAKNYKDMRSAISTSMIFSFILSLILTAIGLLMCKPLMKMLNTPEDIFSDGAIYLMIYISGFLFLFIYNITTGIFNSLGDSQTPLYFLIASSIGNVVLDLIFVAIFGWGVAGVAIATFIAQGIACVLSLIVLFKRLKKVKIESYKKFDLLILKKIAVIAIPSILQQSFVSVGNTIIQIIINGYGSAVIAGYSATIKLNTFAITSMTTLGNGISGFTAQNVGAGKIERVHKGFKTGIIEAFIVSLIFFACYFGMTKTFLMLFMNQESTGLALSTGTQFMKIITPFYFIISIKMISDGVLRGTGAMLYFMISTFSDLILRVVLAIIFSNMWGVIGVWLSWPVGWTIGTIFSVIFTIYILKIKK